MRASTMGVMPVASLHGLLFLSLESVKMHLVDGLFFWGPTASSPAGAQVSGWPAEGAVQ